MKKILIIFTSIILFTVLSLIILNTGSSSNSLYLLNWGEYIDSDLVLKFEEEYNCTVVEETVTSSETMYQKITSKTTPYDVAIPGDYMVKKLYEEDMLYKLDVTNEKYQNLNNYENMFTDSLTKLRKENMNETLEYSMPYFWGAYSIIYSTLNEEVESVVKENGFNALFDKTLYKSDIKSGMYSTARWAVSSYLVSKGLNPNEENIDIATSSSDIKEASFDVWGDDQLKRKVATGTLDLCFTQLGDFFDALYLALNEGLDKNSDGNGLAGLSFNVYVPETTIAFFDSMVIPKTSKNQELANSFINFMLDSNNAYQNAKAIGYSPTLKSVAAKFEENSTDLYYEDENDSNRNVTVKDLCDTYKYYLDPLYSSNTVYLLEAKDSDYMTMCETIINQAKSNVSSSGNTGTILCISFVTLCVCGVATYITYTQVRKRKRHGHN